MEQEFLRTFSLNIHDSPLSAVEQIRSHSHFPYLSQSDIQNIVIFLNKTSFKYSKTDIKYELYLLFISYHLLPSAYATCRIGEIYFYGRINKKISATKNIRRNYNKALQYLTLASTMSYPKADYLLGMLYLRKMEYNTSFYYLNLSASMCNPDALYELALLYYHGNTTIKQNFQTAYKHFVHSANHGNTLAIFMLRNFGDLIKSRYVAQRIANGMSPITQGECPICLDQKVGYTLSCHSTHFVCCDCLSKLLEAEILESGQIKCPICRAIS
jgi:hypothetical protein